MGSCVAPQMSPSGAVGPPTHCMSTQTAMSTTEATTATTTRAVIVCFFWLAATTARRSACSQRVPTYPEWHLQRDEDSSVTPGWQGRVQVPPLWGNFKQKLCVWGAFFPAKPTLKLEVVSAPRRTGHVPPRGAAAGILSPPSPYGSPPRSFPWHQQVLGIIPWWLCGSSSSLQSQICAPRHFLGGSVPFSPLSEAALTRTPACPPARGSGRSRGSRTGCGSRGTH